MTEPFDIQPAPQSAPQSGSRSCLSDGLANQDHPRPPECEDHDLLYPREDLSQHDCQRTPSGPSVKPRSYSDAASSPLSPSPKFRDSPRSSKDDTSIESDPVIPRRPDFLSRGLSLQMPPRVMPGPNTAGFADRVPLSPKLDASNTYGAPVSVLPRRSRGLDFSRACTNLHHSTIAEQSSPDSSPTMAGKGMTIPPRKGPSGFPSSIDSPSGTFNSLWSTMGNPDKTGIPSSVGSVNMLDTDSASSDSDQDELLDPNDYDDPILTTPQVYRLGNSVTPLNSASPFTTGANSLPGENLATFSPAAASLMSFQRARFRGARSRKSSSSASGQSSMASPSPKSPPLTKSTESTAGGYFARELARKNSEPRRESLTFGTNELHISGGAEWEECLQAGAGPGSNSIAASQSNDEKRGVIRRPVTRRGNLLPQTKNFARIRAALMEESAPVDSDVKRESEVIRQVRESEPDLEPAHHPCQPTMDDHSPHLIPMVPGIPDALEGIPEDEIMSGDNAARTHDTERTDNFTRQAMKNSGGLEFWNSFDAQKRTPPPSLRRDSQWGLNDDISMESPAGSVAPSSQMIFPSPQQQTSKPTSRSSTPQPCAFPSAADMNRKVSKRRRDDDFSINSLKRRAVSPGVSVQSSPVMTHSPGQREGLWGSLSRSGRELVPPAPGAHGIGERANSASSANSSVVGPTVKRVGFQGMSDTNDGLMNMSIE